MEPVSIVLASAAAGGVVGKLSERIVEHLYASFTRGHADETRKKAAVNTEAFAEALFRYVDAKLAGETGLAEDRIEERLTDPDFASTLETATRAASRTNNAERHTLLAQLVTERLTSESTSVESVAVATAIEVLPRLAPLHVEMLGLHTATNQVRPCWWGDFSVANEDEHVEWLLSLLSLYDLEIKFQEQDVWYLASVGCIRQVDINWLISRPRTAQTMTDGAVWHRIEGHVVYERLQQCWAHGLSQTILLPVGAQIGRAVYESRASGSGEGQS
jgi:hypothetical protein